MTIGSACETLDKSPVYSLSIPQAQGTFTTTWGVLLVLRCLVGSGEPFEGQGMGGLPTFAFKFLQQAHGLAYVLSYWRKHDST
ncbi:hypothetical protein MalM14_00850 [Gimesia chilikensis]|nr:hypothetical protein MalM14_00850 [Gimesia chilikensis]